MALSQEFLIPRNACHQIKSNQISHSWLWIGVKGNLGHNIKRGGKGRGKRKGEEEGGRGRGWSDYLWEIKIVWVIHVPHICSVFLNVHWTFSSCWSSNWRKRPIEICLNIFISTYITTYLYAYVNTRVWLRIVVRYHRDHLQKKNKPKTSTAKHLHLLFQIQTPRRA